MICRWRENGRRARLGRVAPDQGRLATRAEGQAQRVEDDGFARPGLAGEDGQARAEGQVEAVHEHHIADGESDQHGLGG